MRESVEDLDQFTVDELIQIVGQGELNADQLASAISELGFLLDERAIPTLIEATDHDDWFIRSHAGTALQNFTTPEAMAAVESLSDDSSRMVRIAARVARRSQSKPLSRSSRKWRKSEARQEQYRAAGEVDRRLRGGDPIGGAGRLRRIRRESGRARG